MNKTGSNLFKEETYREGTDIIKIKVRHSKRDVLKKKKYQESLINLHFLS